MKMAVVGKSVWYKMKKTLRGVPFLENNQLQADSSNSALSTHQCRWWFSYNGTPQSVLSFIYWMQVMKVLRLALCSHMGQHIKVKGERWKQERPTVPDGMKAACWWNCMLVRACWYWNMPVLNMAVAPLVFSSAGLFGNGGKTGGIPWGTKHDGGEREKKTEGGNIIYETKKKKKSSNKILTVNYIIIKIVLHLIM